MKKIVGNSVIAMAVAIGLNTAGIMSAQAAGFNEAMTNGSFEGSLRPRVESVDQEGNLYGTDNQAGRPQKMTPRPDADPALLIPRPYYEK